MSKVLKYYDSSIRQLEESVEYQEATMHYRTCIGYIRCAKDYKIITINQFEELLEKLEETYENRLINM